MFVVVLQDFLLNNYDKTLKDMTLYKVKGKDNVTKRGKALE